MAATSTPRTSSPGHTRRTASSTPRRQAASASCSSRSGAGARRSCGTRADASTVPSPSTASALTDVDPMSTPTVTSAMSADGPLPQLAPAVALELDDLGTHRRRLQALELGEAGVPLGVPLVGEPAGGDALDDVPHGGGHVQVP